DGRPCSRSAAHSWPRTDRTCGGGKMLVPLVVIPPAFAVAIVLAHHHGRTSFVLVDANREVTDHVFVNRGLALQLVDDGGGAIDIEHHEMRLAVTLDLV